MTPDDSAWLALDPAPKLLFLRDAAGALRDHVSTDEITPVHIMSHYDGRLARFPYTVPLRHRDADRTRHGAGRRLPGDGGGTTLRQGLVAREHSPATGKLAGIRLVMAASFEHIYRQNADHIGLFTPTDMTLVGRIERGELLSFAALQQHTRAGA